MELDILLIAKLFAEDDDVVVPQFGVLQSADSIAEATLVAVNLAEKIDKEPDTIIVRVSCS